MNLSIYEPDENEITKGTEPLEEDGTENILAFEMPRVLEVQKYMSVAEAAGILGETEENIRIGISRCLLPVTEIDGELKIIKALFEKHRVYINNFFKTNSDEEK